MPSTARPHCGTNGDAPIERLWTVHIAGGSTEPYPGKSAQLAKACGDGTLVPGLTAGVYYECRAKVVKPARYRLTVLHASPSDSSPVVASVFEERRVADDNQLEFTWIVELASRPGEPLPWPDSVAAFDYGLHIAGVQRRGNWVRLLSSVPADGWLRAIPEGEDRAASQGSAPLSIYISVSPLGGQIVDMSPLTASWPDGRQRLIEKESYLIQRVRRDGSVEFRKEIPSDFARGEPVTDPVPPPPTLRAPVEFFNRHGTPRFSTKYPKGC